jgi:hypothetical protein
MFGAITVDQIYEFAPRLRTKQIELRPLATPVDSRECHGMLRARSGKPAVIAMVKIEPLDTSEIQRMQLLLTI